MISIVTDRPEYFEVMGFNHFSTTQDVIDYFKDKEFVGLDLETTGMSFCTADIWSLQLGDENMQFVIDINKENKKLIEYRKVIEGRTIVGQNLLFDIPFLYNQGIINLKVFDTLLASQVMSLGVLNYKRNLGALIQRYLNIEIDKSVQDNIAETGLNSWESVEYSANDVRYIIPLMNKMLESAESKGQLKAIELENKFCPVLAYVEFCGMYIDTNEWYRLVRKLEYEEYGAEDKLKNYLRDTVYSIKQEPIYDPEVFNWASNQQVEKLFREEYGIDTYDSKNGKHTIVEGHLVKQNHEVIPLYLDYKKKAKAVTTYGRNWFDYPQDDKRIHTKYKQLVSTGRMACGNVRSGPFPNLQNVMADPTYRRCFKGQGANTLIVCDYSAQEGVIMADKSQEPALLEFYQNDGGDIHSYTAKLLWPDKIGHLTHKEVKQQYPDLRQKAKAAGFAISFGGTGYTIADNLNISKKDGERVFQAFMKAFPELDNYFSKVSAAALKEGSILVHPKTGHKRFLQGFTDYIASGRRDKKFEGMVYRKSLNTPVQATAAAMTKLACIFFFNWILKNKRFGKVKLVNIVHDELVVECNQRVADRVAPVVQECMEKAGSKLLNTLKIKAVPEITKVWLK